MHKELNESRIAKGKPTRETMEGTVNSQKKTLAIFKIRYEQQARKKDKYKEIMQEAESIMTLIKNREEVILHLRYLDGKMTREIKSWMMQQDK